MSNVLSKKKLSVSTVVGDMKKMVAKGEIANGAVIYRAIGIADGMRTGTSTYGDWAGFLGEFEVTNCLTGEVFRGAQFFPDRAFTEMLSDKLKKSNGDAVEFALECTIDIDDKYPTGYSYVARPLMENSVNRLEGLRQRLPALLEAPADKKANKK